MLFRALGMARWDLYLSFQRTLNQALPCDGEWSRLVQAAEAVKRAVE